jgi:SEC-C motif
LSSAGAKYTDARAHALRERYRARFGGPELPVPVESIAEDLLGLTIREAGDLDISGMLIPAEREIVLNTTERDYRDAAASRSGTSWATGSATSPACEKQDTDREVDRRARDRAVEDAAERASGAAAAAPVPSVAMDSAALDLCTCGSGLAFEACHGDPRNDYARETALREARAIAALFPAVRVGGPAVDRFLDAAAAGLDDDTDPDDDLLAEGLTLVDDQERRRVVDSWTVPYADRWESLTRAAADAEGAQRELVLGALEMGVLERVPTPRDLLEIVDESGLRTPSLALALVVPPGFVWSRDEAGAAVAASELRRKPLQRDRAVAGVASALVTYEHVRRLRALAGRVAGELPVAGLPAASDTLAMGCRDVELDLDAARQVLAALLMAYVQQLELA